MNLSRKKIFLLGSLALIFILAGYFVWSLTASSTRIGFLNYQPVTLAQIAKAKNNSFIKLENIDPEDPGRLSRFDMIFINGMGLRLTDDRRALLNEAAGKGLPILTTAATNPDNLIVSVDSVDAEFLKQYLANGSKENYRSMLNYVRKFIDVKHLFIKTISDPKAASDGMFYHADPNNPDADNLTFNSLKEYDDFLSSTGLMRRDAPAVILTGRMGVPEELTAELENSGIMVYPISNLMMAITSGVADSIPAVAVINLAHGRLGDKAVEFLTQKNIPLFSPLNVNRDYEEWMEDKMGMSGGFMSQSIVTPEIDGAIRPWALFAQFTGPDGLPEIKAIPERLQEFVATVRNYISLSKKSNADKKIAIFYFKGPGQNSLIAEGMEVAPSLFNLLSGLKNEGYKVENLPSSPEEFEDLLNRNGKVFGQYAAGAMNDFVKSANPQLISKNDYEKWLAESVDKEMIAEINAIDGDFPGHGLKTEDGLLAIARLDFGNVTLIPQTAAGLGDDDFKIIHGTDQAPPHAYVASYLWARNGFNADAIIHFGAHGSLEFTPRHQVALSSRDWADRLIGPTPHLYLYSSSNVGEAMIAKRRSYAGIINYLTPPFVESGLRSVYNDLSSAINSYNSLARAEQPDPKRINEAARNVKKLAVELGIHRDLRLDSTISARWSASDIARVENFAEELANEKIIGRHYVMGQPYSPEEIRSTVAAMTVDPIAYSLFALDRLRGKLKGEYTPKGAAFTNKYLLPARRLADRLLSENRQVSDDEICKIAGISSEELQKAGFIIAEQNESKDLISKMIVMSSSMTPNVPAAKLADKKASRASRMKKMMNVTGMTPEQAVTSKYSQAEIDKAVAISEIEKAVTGVGRYADALRRSPEAELASVINALNGGYICPSPGGDPVANPMILPTGRNLFAINAEETPSASAWEKGKTLAENTLSMYKEAHGDSLPRKVSYTLWSSEFIETEGATIAQILYMLGVEPIRDPFGRVTDLRLIPDNELGRPRVDVVVQTSGQLRDLAASRLFLISRAIEMAADAPKGKFPNYVAEGVIESERTLIDKGVPPKEARVMSKARVFGGVNGNYGTGIREMVEAGDRWENESQIAETYINNMGATYGSEEDWGKMRDYAFEAALTRTDIVVQPRQSNTWGALSLDHVYEFMGGMNLAVRNVTGKDPDAYLADYRNRNHAGMQEVKEAIGIESRSTILNPNYIREKMKGGAGDASTIADVVRNTYGWNVMKPDAIDNQLWNDIYDTFILDSNNLGIKEYFTSINPAALEEISAVMLESARKGLWKASENQIETIARLHTGLVEKYRPSCSGFVCNNSELQDFIADKVDPAVAKSYKTGIAGIRNENPDAADAQVLKKEQLNETNTRVNRINGILVGGIAALLLILLFIILIRRRRKLSESSEAKDSFDINF